MSTFIDGVAAFDNCDYKKAITAFSKCVSIKSGDNNSLSYLGRAYLHDKQPAKAIEYLTRVPVDSDTYKVSDF